MRTLFALAFCATCLSLASVIGAQSSAAAQEQNAPDADQVTAHARQLLDAGLKSNGLEVSDVKPWHVKVDFQQVFNMSGGQLYQKGSMEEWFAAPYQWRRTYSGERKGWNGSEWTLSKVERYAKGERHEELNDYSLMFRIARPLLNPLFQIANIKTTDQLTIRRVNASDMAVSCVSLSAKSAAERGKKPGWLVPTMCFDDDSHLRIIRSEDTILEFNDIQMFAGKAVPRDVKISESGHLSAEIQLKLIESVDTVNAGILKPPHDASFRPYIIERGWPKPVSVYEEGAKFEHPPLLPNGQPFVGNWLVPVFIHKDGTITLHGDTSAGPMREIVEAIHTAVAKWRFQPYLVDGQPVEADYYVPYPIDGNAFVPSYQRTPTAGDDVAGGRPGL